jgi:hypothetical protein
MQQPALARAAVDCIIQQVDPEHRVDGRFKRQSGQSDIANACTYESEWLRMNHMICSACRPGGTTLSDFKLPSGYGREWLAGSHRAKHSLIRAAGPVNMHRSFTPVTHGLLSSVQLAEVGSQPTQPYMLPISV